MRSQLLMRPAKDADVPALALIWADVLRRGDRDQQVEDVRRLVDRVSALHEERIVVAEQDGAVVGAVHLKITTFSPINLEPVVWAVSPHVLPEYRRHGIGSALMEAAVAFAEEVGVGHVGTAVSSGARDSQRFMARLALGPAATLRVAPTGVVRGRIQALWPAQRPGPGRTAGRHLPRVLAARRSMRRSEAEQA